jgi:serine phosphatase RsbU (regulator of sigma subunit)/anti-sigma regulatory factor (Ser/Thr protein kinase)
MIHLGELRVQAVRENLRTISYFIHGIARRLRLTEKTLFDIELAVEEAAMNVVSHAYPPGQQGDLLIRAEVLDGVMRLTLIDWGSPLDPAQVKPFDLDAPVEARIAGGMGLHLIQNLMDRVVRETAAMPGEPNKLILTKEIEQLLPGERRPSSARELHAMRTVSQFMVTGMELESLLRLIINELVEAIGAGHGTLFLIEEESGELVSRLLLEDSGMMKETRFRINEGIAGHVATTGQVLNIPEASEDPRCLHAFDEISGYQIRTVLAAPMRNPQGKIIGVVQLLNKQGGAFTARDERLLEAMAAQAAISIENARLYEQEIQQRLLNQELETARIIQKSFLPQTIPQYPGWNIGAFWRPMREVAGDYYDFYALPDGRLAVVIADVSGKGVPAALFMALSVTVLRFAMGLNFSPGELLDRANQAIIADQQSRMFATVFVGYLDLEKSRLQYASAGHNPPMLFRAGGQRCEFLEASGVAMGLFEAARFSEGEVTLDEGDILVLYTDGITEVFNAQEEEFGEARLARLVIANAGRSAQALSDLVVEAARAFAVEDGMVDDETLIVIKRLTDDRQDVHNGRLDDV